MTNVIIFFLGFVIAILIGQFFKVNAGFVAIIFGFILNWVIVGDNAAGFIRLFPVTLFWNYGIPIIFYAFASANEPFRLLARKLSGSSVHKNGQCHWLFFSAQQWLQPAVPEPTTP